jgi:hypothetical protein
MQLSTGYFSSDFVKICDFMPEMPFNSASVLIRSSKFFLKICQVRWICMLIGLLPTPIPSLWCRFFVPKSLNFEPKCDPILNRSIPFNSE